MDLKVLTTQAAKRQQLKNCKVSPDGFLQMSFQLAYHKLYKKTVTTYESASTAAYKHGRTEVIRSATPQASLFTKAFSSPSATVILLPFLSLFFLLLREIVSLTLVCFAQVEEKNKLLRDAINYHSKITVEALMGKGVDRHLFALRSYAQKHGDVPDIFKDKGKTTLSWFVFVFLLFSCF